MSLRSLIAPTIRGAIRDRQRSTVGSHLPSHTLGQRPTNPQLSLYTFATLATRLGSSPFTSNPTPINNEPFVDSDLFEEESDEYQRIQLIPREHKEQTPAWPTIFPSSSSSPEETSSPSPLPTPIVQSNQTTSPTTLPCELISRLLREGDLPSATQVRKELLAMGTAIKPRDIFLDASFWCLLPGTYPSNNPHDIALAQKESLIWLGLWLNLNLNLTPASIASKKKFLSLRLETLTSLILDRYTDDVQFIAEFLDLAASKGFLELVMKQLLPHITVLAPPAVSYGILNACIVSYRERSESLSGEEMEDGREIEPREGEEEGLLQLQKVNYEARARELPLQWRNLHLTCLLSSGYIQESKEIYLAGIQASPKVEWSTRVKEKLLAGLKKLEQKKNRELTKEQKGRKRQREGWDEFEKIIGAGAEARAALEAEVAESTGLVESDTQEVLLSAKDLPLGRRILKSAHIRSSQSMAELQDLLTTLYSIEPPPYSLIDRLKSYYVPPQHRTIKSKQRQIPAAATEDGISKRAHKSTVVTANFWYMAEMSRLISEKRNEEAVRLFARTFHWIGLPRPWLLKLYRDVNGETLGAKVFLDSLEEPRKDGMLDIVPSRRVDSTQIQQQEILTPPWKLYPSKEVITTILPAIVRLLKGPYQMTVPEFQLEFTMVSTRLPPVSRPDRLSYLPFIDFLCKECGPQSGQDFVESLERQGIQVGVEGWSAVGLAWAYKASSGMNFGRKEPYAKMQAVWELLAERSRLEQSLPEEERVHTLVPTTLLGPAQALLRSRTKRGMSQARSVMKQLVDIFPKDKILKNEATKFERKLEQLEAEDYERLERQGRLKEQV